MVTRGEFVKFVQNGVLVNKEDTSCAPFPDISSTSTFFKHVTTIKCLGIASGFLDGQFKPNQNITRGEATKIGILSVKKRANDNTTLVAKTTSAPFSDVPVGSSFIQSVIPAKENNIVSGVTNNEFRPNEMLTRGEISKIVFNVRKLLKIENEKVVSKDIVDTALGISDFSSLTTALTKADLVNTLKGTGPFTVFAPTNSAFAEIPSATLNDLLTNPAKKTDLTNILLDHVVSGEVALNKNVNTSATTLGTDTVTISTSGETIKVNQENVLDVVKVSNGTIYVIDGVLLPD